MTVAPHWPRIGAPLLQGVYRASPEDFLVDELPAWTADGEGEHLLVQVRKRGANTAWVAEALARRAGASPREVGWCGEKDRHAVTTQWFSIRDPLTRFTPIPGDGEEGWTILASDRHGRKLRPGDHAGNRFRLRIHLAPGQDPEVLLPAVSRCLAAGVPNYFGPQRFGRDGANLDRVRAWVNGGRLPGRGPARGRILSSARAFLFNEVLASRVRSGTAGTLLDGDVSEDGIPTGPLWGRGRAPVTAVAAQVEAAALAPHAAWCERLEHAGLAQARRPLLCVPRACEVLAEGQTLLLDFVLAPGMFATAVLNALGDLADAQRSSARTDAPVNESGRALQP
jgi:tRNA pseudouridine13 synthase